MYKCIYHVAAMNRIPHLCTKILLYQACGDRYAHIPQKHMFYVSKQLSLTTLRHSYNSERERAHLVLRWYMVRPTGYGTTDRIPYISKCFYALLFHRHLSRTQYGSKERRATESDETREIRLRRTLERASCF